MAELRQLVSAADGPMVSSPKYAHGVPGSLKNLLDWTIPTIRTDMRTPIPRDTRPTSGSSRRPAAPLHRAEAVAEDGPARGARLLDRSTPNSNSGTSPHTSRHN